MKESTLERKVVAYCRANALLCYKFVSPSNSGVPDRLILGRGRVLFLELKAPGEKPSAFQEYELKTLIKAGLDALWVDTFEAAKAAIDRQFDDV